MTNTTINDLPIVRQYNKATGFLTYMLYYLRTQGIRIAFFSTTIILSFLGFGWFMSDMEAEDFVILFQSIATVIVITAVVQLRKLFEDKNAPLDSYKILQIKLYTSFFVTGLVISTMNVYISIQGRLLEENRAIAQSINKSPQSAKEAIVSAKKVTVKETFKRKQEEAGIEQLNGFIKEEVANLQATNISYDLAPANPTALKREEVNAFIQRFAAIAKNEEKQFGIPKEITLAQAIIESRCGTSVLAVKCFNFFGIKCFKHTAKNAGSHCAQYHDDKPTDRFIIHNNAWESFRKHSNLLIDHGYAVKGGYKEWAYSLQKKGYATDSEYSKKLLSTIKLYKLDKI